MKQPYRKAILKDLGKVKDLTLGASGMSMDSGSQGMMPMMM